MRNYQIELDNTVARIMEKGERKSVLLHSCCGPCSTYCLEYLTGAFDVTVFFYNPNIQPAREYYLRLSEQKKVIGEIPFASPVKLIEGKYEPLRYEKFIQGFEGEKEGGARCEKCFVLRLEETAKEAKEGGYDYFTTTLTVSPHKNAPLINEIGERIAEKYGVPFLPTDFKKKNGYLRSIELSKQYGIYRQDYCGCRFANPNAEKGEDDV